MIRNLLWTLSALFVLAATAPAAAPDRYLPSDTEQVVVINFKQLVGSKVFGKYLKDEADKALKDLPQYKQLQDVTGGFDVFTDVNSITLANSGSKGDKALVIVRGKFDLEKIGKAAETYAKTNKDDLEISKLGERSLYKGVVAGQTVYSSFIDSTTVVLSPSKELVTAAAEGKGGQVARDVAQAVQGVDGKSSIWIAGRIPAEAKKALGQGQRGPGDLVKKIRTAGGGITLTDGIAVSLSASADAETAKQLANVIDQGKIALGVFLGGNEAIKPLVDELTQTLAVKAVQDTISVSFKVSADNIDKASRVIPKP